MSFIEDKREKGKIGEEIVQSILGGELSEDEFDMSKDLILPSGEYAEIKTQNRYNKMNAFSIDTKYKNQLPKCLTVDRLFFVEYGKNDNINIWESTNREYTIQKVGYREMALFPVDTMTLIAKVELPEEAQRLRDISQADPRWLKDL